MNGRNRRRAMLSWLFLSMLLVLCAVLGYLQYGWIGEVSVASRERLGQTLQRSLNQLRLDLNREIATACQAVSPTSSAKDADAVLAEVGSRFPQWKKTARHSGIFKRIAVAAPRSNELILYGVDPITGALEKMAWPGAWRDLRQQLHFRLESDRRGPPPPQQPHRTGDGLVFEMPVMRPPDPAVRVNPFARREVAWIIFELSGDYLRDSVLPELVQNHLGAGGSRDYQVEVLSRTTPRELIWRSDTDQTESIADTADASVNLLEPGILPSPGRGRGRGIGKEPAPGHGPESGTGPGLGRWQLFVRHRSGSLEALVARARAKNLAVAAGVLILLIASVAALIRFTRQAERLAALQMDFVAGVSHELRTPLTIINTAGYNLRGRMAHNPAHVERYGELIQRESGRLKDLVEQVLGFTKANAGRVIQDREPVNVANLIDETVESSRAVVQQAQGVIEKSVDPGLPSILADPMALKHALGNLLSNAAKYGMKGDNWIGVSARKVESSNRSMVEIAVADRGPGIPEDEQARLFDPFVRGRRAVQDQVHGTGLGLNLAKRIVEAHGGSIQVKSISGKGSVFTVRLPATENESEFASTIDRG